ncbi:MAG: SMC-Scp complex subunit ScpB [Planctomycetia bacterium]|nr:SMC-Scp complex subunit ScpB [Planctomycetia bacterium]
MSFDELSFEELGRAFARAMHGGGENENSASNPIMDDANDLLGDDSEDFGQDSLDDAAAEDEEDENSTSLELFDENAPSVFAFAEGEFVSEIDDDRRVPVTPATVLEAMLFVGNPQNEPLSPATASRLMRGVSEEEAIQLANDLNAQYDRTRVPWRIVFSEKGFLLQLREEYAPLRELFYGKIRQAKLSQVAIDVLSIVAYEQPLTLEEINELRGASCGAVLSQLVRRGLLRVQKARRGVKFLSLYYTTDRFLKLFELESLADLPQSEDL